MLKALKEQNEIIGKASRDPWVMKWQKNHDEIIETIKEIVRKIDPKANVLGASYGYFITIYFSDENKAQKILKKLDSHGYNAELNRSKTAIVVQP